MIVDIRQNISLKKKLLKQARRTKTVEDLDKFKAQRRITSNLMRKAKSELVGIKYFSFRLAKSFLFPKNKEKQFVTNWRPISPLALPGKLIHQINYKESEL